MLLTGIARCVLRPSAVTAPGATVPRSEVMVWGFTPGRRDDGSEQAGTAPGAWTAGPVLQLGIWVLPCPPLPFCDGLWNGWNCSLRSQTAIACPHSILDVRRSFLPCNVTAITVHFIYLWKDFC